MKKFSLTAISLLALTFFFLTGCATNRGIVSLDVPKVSTQIPSNGKQVYIQSVIDERVFQENPKTQDIPSLGFGGASQATADLKKRAIGRKRNTYGKALGDILLEEGQTVETVITDALKQSYTETGYQVLDNENEIKDNTIIVTATIQKFWAYMTPGFWAITLTSDISSNITIKDPSKNDTATKEVTVQSEGKYQIASESNWMEVVHQSLQKFIAEVKKFI